MVKIYKAEWTNMSTKECLERLKKQKNNCYYKKDELEMEKQNVIEVRNLKKCFKVKQKESGFKGSIKSIFKTRYQSIKAFNDISFNVQEGEMLAFLGPNGAGKSTTIKMLTGILYPDSGSIRVLNIDPTKQRKKVAYKIGTVFGQKEQLWMHLTPLDNFKFFGSYI